MIQIVNQSNGYYISINSVQNASPLYAIAILTETNFSKLNLSLNVFDKVLYSKKKKKTDSYKSKIKILVSGGARKFLGAME